MKEFNLKVSEIRKANKLASKMNNEPCEVTGWFPNCFNDDVKNLYVRNFKLGQMENEYLMSLEITIEGRDKL